MAEKMRSGGQATAPQFIPLGDRTVERAGESIDLARAAKMFRALGDETRLSILRQLRSQGEVCACDFVACCDVAQPTVSHHLKVLRENGLVVGEKRGLWVWYRLAPNAIETVRSALP